MSLGLLGGYKEERSLEGGNALRPYKQPANKMVGMGGGGKQLGPQTLPELHNATKVQNDAR